MRWSRYLDVLRWRGRVITWSKVADYHSAGYTYTSDALLAVRFLDSSHEEACKWMTSQESIIQTGYKVPWA